MGLPKNYKCGYQILDLSTYTNGSKLTQEDFDEIVKKLNEYSLINKQILVVLKDFAFVLDTFKVFNALVSMGSRYIYIYKNNVDVVNIDNGYGAGYIATQINRLAVGYKDEE